MKRFLKNHQNNPQSFIMEIITTILFLILMAQTCQGKHQRLVETFYLSENRALLNHVFQWKTVSSTVICGGDCSMDTQCASFNYHTIGGICVLNIASRAHRPGDLLRFKEAHTTMTTWTLCHFHYPSL